MSKEFIPSLNMSEEVVRYLSYNSENKIEGYRDASEKIRSGVLMPLQELQVSGDLGGARLVLFGSSVSEPREPTDLDVFLLYDEYRDLSSREGLSENALAIRELLIKNEARRILGVKDETLSMTKLGAIDVVAISEVQLVTLYERTREENLDFLVPKMVYSMGMLSLLKTAYRLGYKINEDLVEGECGKYIDTLETIAANAPLLLMWANGEDPGLAAVERARALAALDGPDVTDMTLHYSELLGPTGIELDKLSGAILESSRVDLVNSLTEIDPGLALQVEDSFGEYPNTKERSLDRVKIVMEIIKACVQRVEDLTNGTESQKVGRYISKKIRVAVGSYNLGTNLVQGALGSGAVLIHGEDLELPSLGTEEGDTTRILKLDQEFFGDN
ncbi:hypothetical protein KJ608_00950 [Patescibacteria group bacterium]|nr:hypothetical protein [Patescibacteria group bacterium]